MPDRGVLRGGGVHVPERADGVLRRLREPVDQHRALRHGRQRVRNGATCDAGTCRCDPGEVVCSGACTDVGYDEGHCGSCGTPCSLLCLRGSCETPRTIDAGGSHACAAMTGGRVVCWGLATSGQTGPGASSYDVPNDVSEGPLQTVTAGDDHSCGLTAVGGSTVLCWGNNSQGQLGDGRTTNSSVPVEVSGVSDFVAVEAGYQFTCGIRLDGSVMCWGDDTYGQSGGPTTTDKRTPNPVSGVSGATALARGTSSSCDAAIAAIDFCFATLTPAERDTVAACMESADGPPGCFACE